VADDKPVLDPKYTVWPQGIDAATVWVLNGHIGLMFTEITAERLRAKARISATLRRASIAGFGGVYASIAATVACRGGVLSLGGAGHVVAANNKTDVLRFVCGGLLDVQAAPLFCDRREQLWCVVIADGNGQTCAVGGVRLQNVFN
jgi:1,4-dihydroxy-2-naphthoyl-CoA hydrolase